VLVKWGTIYYDFFKRTYNNIIWDTYTVRYFDMNLLFDAPVQLSKRTTVNGDGEYTARLVFT